MATEDFGGLLFGQGGTGLEDYLTPQQLQAMQQQGMLTASAALLAASGERPVGQGINLGQAVGSALLAGQQGYNQAQTGAINTLMAQQKLREAKIAADLQKQVASTFAEPITVPEGGAAPKAEDIKFNQYMKLANMYAVAGKGEEAKRFQDMAYQIKPRAEVTGAPFEVTGADNKPLLVQQMKDGSIRTVEGYGPKRDVVLQNLGGRTVAIDKSKLTGGESFTQTLAPQVVGGAETGYYVVGGGGGGVAPAPSAGGQRTTTPPVGTTIMRPDYRPAPSTPAGQVVAPAGNVPPVQGLQPIIAGTGTKPSAEFMKASKQLNDLEGALKDYKSEIASDKWILPKNIPLPFSDTGIPLPTGADSARVAGKYNSLLMGVKNLYELGALTGPDMAIIERQLTNPSSWAGLLTSKNAMNEQIKILEDMLVRSKENLGTSYKQIVPAASTAGGVREFVWVNGQLVPKQ
jgi:hypothetical protein